MRNGDFEKAVRWFHKAAQMSPDDLSITAVLLEADTMHKTHGKHESRCALRTITDCDCVCKGRDNVRPTGEKTSAQMTLGPLPTANHFGDFLMPTIKTLRNPGLCFLLTQWRKLSIPDAETFQFTTKQLTRNMQSKPHYDTNNAGRSYGVYFGDHQGGKLSRT